LAVIDVKPFHNDQLLLTVDNGEKRLFDVRPYLDKGIFRDLRDETVFRSVRVSFDSIAWRNQADIDPEGLYDYSVAYRLDLSGNQGPPRGELAP